MPRFHHQRCSDEHYGQTAPVCAVVEYMDPNNIPFNALIMGPTNSGKTQYLVHQLWGPFRGKFDCMVLKCLTFVHNKTHDEFANHDSRIFVINCPQEEVELWLKLNSYFFPGCKHAYRFGRLCCLERCLRLHRSAGFSRLFGLLRRHQRVSSYAFLITSIAKPFCENVAVIGLVYTPSGKTMQAIFDVLAAELSPEEYKELMAEQKKIFLSGLRPAPSSESKFSVNI